MEGALEEARYELAKLTEHSAHQDTGCQTEPLAIDSHGFTTETQTSPRLLNLARSPAVLGSPRMTVVPMVRQHCGLATNTPPMPSPQPVSPPHQLDKASAAAVWDSDEMQQLDDLISSLVSTPALDKIISTISSTIAPKHSVAQAVLTSSTVGNIQLARPAIAVTTLSILQSSAASSSSNSATSPKRFRTNSPQPLPIFTLQTPHSSPPSLRRHSRPITAPAPPAADVVIRVPHRTKAELAGLALTKRTKTTLDPVAAAAAMNVMALAQSRPLARSVTLSTTGATSDQTLTVGSRCSSSISQVHYT